MQSYQDVKREGDNAVITPNMSVLLTNTSENIRKLFYRWLSAARSSRHRSLVLQKKEDEMKFTAVAIAWDRWRERFKDERLRPLVRNR